jgi:hypothetical protein
MIIETYWLDAESDRTGLDIVINGVPAEHLLLTNGIRLPINEFLVAGLNRVELRRGIWPSNADDAEGGNASLQLIRARFDGTVKLGEEVVMARTASFQAAVPRSVLVAAEFQANVAGLASRWFDPLGLDGRDLVMAQLRQVAEYWRSGDGDALVEWMHGYITDYVRANPQESVDAMSQRVKAMAKKFRGARVVFDPAQVLIEPIAGTNLVDCLSAQGAAVRVVQEKGRPYDMWAVVGLSGGKVVLFR